MAVRSRRRSVGARWWSGRTGPAGRGAVRTLGPMASGREEAGLLRPAAGIIGVHVLLSPNVSRRA